MKLFSIIFNICLYLLIGTGIQYIVNGLIHFELLDFETFSIMNWIFQILYWVLIIFYSIGLEKEYDKPN